MKMSKSISINPTVFIAVEKLIDDGKVASFSKFTETAILKHLKDYND